MLIAPFGSRRVSPERASTGRPMMPPLALSSATAYSVPSLARSAMKAMGDVRGAEKPTLIGSAARAGAGPRHAATRAIRASRVMRVMRECLPFLPHRGSTEVRGHHARVLPEGRRRALRDDRALLQHVRPGRQPEGD